ncbi:MAG: peptidylprolyl isomerase [Gemmatimonadetes bacterium]|nr:peptidylprolyl isomerase [Gemmatimonadota bacterium]
MYPDHHIPLDVYHGRRLRSVRPDSATLALLRNPGDARWREASPASFVAEFETTRGNFAIEVTRAWAPYGADRFYQLVRNGYFDDGRFHRVLPGYIAQWGVHGDPAVYARWKSRFIPSDPPTQSNVRGTIGFAMVSPEKRSTQVYINLRDNSRNDPQGFAPFGRVIEGLEVVDSLYSGYGERAGGGLRAGRQGPLEQGGNAWLARGYPKLDWILRASIRTLP